MLARPGSGFGMDPNSSEGLLAIANAHGGAVAEAANELAHPTTGILSTVGNGLKKSLSTFIDVLSLPSETLAGALSADYTISQAIKKNITPSDIIFGQQEKYGTLMTKTGSFLTRTAVDIMLDPLTYVTFGTGKAGLLAAQGATKIPLGVKAAEQIGKEAAHAAVVSRTGQNLYSLLKKVEGQAKGFTKMDQLTGGTKIAQDIAKATGLSADEAYDFTKTELKEVLEETIDAPLNIDFAKKAMSSLLEKYPQLAETLLDKGGIKFFGQTILSGQRISAATKMIPGMTLLDNATAPVRNSIQALFDPEMVKLSNGQWQRIPDEGTWLMQSAKDLAESMKDGRINKLGDIVKANKLNTNEAAFLLASVEARKVPTDARLANAYKQLMGFNKDEFAALRKAGIPISFLDKHVPHILVKGTAKVLPFSLPPSTKVAANIKRTMDGTIFNADAGQLEAIEGALLSKEAEKANKMLQELKTEGFEIFDDNIVTALARRSVDNTKAITTKNFLDALPAHFAQTADVAPDGWVPLNLSQFKKEEEFFNAIGQSANALRFHPAIAARVEKFLGSVVNDDATNEALKAFDSLQNFWKASVTSIFPAFHGRNAISNVFMHFNDLGLNSFNPKNHAVATQIVATDRNLNKLQLEMMKPNPKEGTAEEIAKIMTRKVFTDATGFEWTYGELHRVMKNNNIAFNRNIVGSLDVTKGTDSLVSDLFPTTQKDIKSIIKRQTSDGGQNFVAFKAGREVGRAIEEQARALDFVVNLQKTGDVQLAALRTKQFLFDYQNLTAFEKTFLRRIMPFYTFTRKNIEMQVKTFMTTPGVTAAQVTALTNLGDAIAGDKLTDEEEAALPDWIKTGINILRKKEGNLVEIYGSLGTPLEASFSALQPNNMLGSLSPLMRVPVEMASGYNFFQGKAISEVTNASAFKHAPQPIKDLIGYTEVKGRNSNGQTYNLSMSLRPEMMHLFLNLPPTTRVLTAIRQMTNENVEEDSRVLQALIGLRPYSFDLEQEAQKRENEMKKKLSDLLTSAGITAQFSRTFIPKD